MPAIGTACRIRSTRDAQAFLAPRLAQADHERFCAAYLDGGGMVLGDLVVDGGPRSAAMPLRRLIGRALRLDASAIVLGHNHPGGSREPSREDLAMTREVAQLASALEIRLQDHLILLPGGEAISLRARGLL